MLASTGGFSIAPPARKKFVLRPKQEIEPLHRTRRRKSTSLRPLQTPRPRISKDHRDRERAPIAESAVWRHVGDPNPWHQSYRQMHTMIFSTFPILNSISRLASDRRSKVCHGSRDSKAGGQFSKLPDWLLGRFGIARADPSRNWFLVNHR